VVSDHTPGELSEALLAEALLRREPWAAETVWRHHAPAIFAFLGRGLGRSADIEQLTQEVFLRVLTRIKSLNDPSALQNFIYSLAVGVMRRELRRSALRRLLPRRRRQAGDAEAEWLDRESRSVLTRLYEVLDELSPLDRIIFVLRQIEGFSYAEMAEVLARPAATLRRKFERIDARVEALVQADPLLEHYLAHAREFETERQEGA
jgi:RNA polymerase sigma-70 factor (ECF subfamily)